MSIYGTTGGGAGDAQRQAAGARSEAAAAQREARELSDRLERLTLVCNALWELLKEKTGATEEDLTARVALLDAQDGTADGKRNQKVLKCPQCARTMNARAPKCIYCGAERPIASVFDTI